MSWRPLCLSIAFVACSGGNGSQVSETANDAGAPIANDAGANTPTGDTADLDASSDVPFIAMDESFQPYLTWQSFFLGNQSADSGGVHVAGPHWVYIHRLPAKGSTVFPKGTIIVKAIKNGPMSNWQMFAMVKRGGDFNFFGALDWEWFGLKSGDDGTVVVEWRGAAPPSSAGYGSATGGDVCNSCHSAASANDYVQSAPLNLSTLQ